MNFLCAHHTTKKKKKKKDTLIVSREAAGLKQGCSRTEGTGNKGQQKAAEGPKQVEMYDKTSTQQGQSKGKQTPKQE